MDTEKSRIELNKTWEKRIKDSGADFVYFVDISMFPQEMTDGHNCAVLFGKALSKEYIGTLKAGLEPKRKEVFNTERKMDSLSVKFAEMLEAEGYSSVAKLKTGRFPHKTAALRAGLGFIGKNNLLVTEKYGCAVMLGKVLTSAPFITTSETPKEPQCRDCTICVNVCQSKALLGKTWSITTTREEIIVRKQCTLCLKCMVFCPYTAKYIE
ncbi:MAG: hypothetical protein Q4Q53_06075 [Methanocorpusculum sp.]|nr:hypothetical protein [Methanocorpusculum sp.]